MEIVGKSECDEQAFYVEKYWKFKVNRRRVHQNLNAMGVAGLRNVFGPPPMCHINWKGPNEYGVGPRKGIETEKEQNIPVHSECSERAI